MMMEGGEENKERLLMDGGMVGLLLGMRYAVKKLVAVGKNFRLYLWCL